MVCVMQIPVLRVVVQRKPCLIHLLKPHQRNSEMPGLVEKPVLGVFVLVRRMYQTTPIKIVTLRSRFVINRLVRVIWIQQLSTQPVIWVMVLGEVELQLDPPNENTNQVHYHTDLISLDQSCQRLFSS